jgi:hypothetical protein
MLLVSEIQGFHPVDDQNKIIRLADLSIDLLNEDYPPIKQILLWDDERN